MLPQDKIGKTSWTLHESVKDSISKTLVDAIRSSQLKIEAASVERLLAVIDAAADAGYHQGYKNFMKVVKSAVSEATDDALMPDLKASSQKK